MSTDGRGSDQDEGAPERRERRKSLADRSSPLMEGISSAVSNPMLQYGLAETAELGETAVAGIKKLATGQWLLNLNSPQGEVPHVSVNPHVTGQHVPPLQVSEGFVHGAQGLSYALGVLNATLPYASITLDVYRLGSSIYDDVRRNESYETTFRTVASVVGGYIGGHAGAALGSYVGGVVGGAIGSVLGVYGGVVGSVLGSFVLGFGGGILGAQFLGGQMEKIVAKSYEGVPVWVQIREAALQMYPAVREQ